MKLRSNCNELGGILWPRQRGLQIIAHNFSHGDSVFLRHKSIDAMVGNSYSDTYRVVYSKSGMLIQKSSAGFHDRCPSRKGRKRCEFSPELRMIGLMVLMNMMTAGVTDSMAMWILRTTHVRAGRWS